VQRYVAFLRGVGPMNAKMAELRRAFEQAGFSDVKTVLGSGNVVFSASCGDEQTLARRAEKVMQTELPQSFATTVRSVDYLRRLIEKDPFAEYALSPRAKRAVTFLLRPKRTRLTLPLELDDAVILAKKGQEAFSTYTSATSGPTLMRLIEKTFGKEVTSRSWDTVLKVAR